jgi:hypothetical protein
MKTSLRFLTAVFSLGIFAGSAVAAEPPRLKRADSFLGIHFDFHAGPGNTEVGKNTTPAMVQRIIDLVRPDYLQIDCKGHTGYTSYPTKIGQQVPSYVGDPLRIWRDVTAANGVALYMHYSGVWDGVAVKKPGWAALAADGKPSERATSFWGPYADQLLIPQLRELAGDYGVDGVWVDGECWAAVPDYGAASLAAFTKTTGITAIPRKAGEPHWLEFLQFQREAFRGYLRHYLAEVKRTHPTFQICSNWAFTDHMPEPVSVPVDFLSGDYSPDDSVNSARLSARFLVRQGVAWDLMAWSFSNKSLPAPGPRPQKTAVQLQREAAIVLALGGGFQAYYKQKGDGSIFDEQMPVMAEVAKFCRERQAVVHRSTPVPQIGLLFSTAAHYRMINGLFSRNNARVGGVLQALLESQLAVDVVNESQLAGHLADYPILVVPEWQYLDPAFKADLVAYAKNGGNLLLVGPRTAALFQAELGVTLEGTAKANAPFFLGTAAGLAAVTGDRQAVTLGAAAVAVGEVRATSDATAPGQPAASIARLGRGQIAATYFSFAVAYNKEPNEAARVFLADLVRRLVPQPLVEVTGSRGVDVSVARNHGKLLINLVNTSGPHRTQGIIDSIAPTEPLAVSVRLAAKPARITLEPGARPVPFTYRDGVVRLTVPGVVIHDIVALTP